MPYPFPTNITFEPIFDQFQKKSSNSYIICQYFILLYMLHTSNQDQVRDEWEYIPNAVTYVESVLLL